MISKQLVKGLIDQKLENTDVFLVSLSISSSNAIRVVLDADSGVSIEKCIEVSRQVEHNLDRENEDFSLEVTSFGLGEPLVLIRQYHKNKGRNVKIALSDGQTVLNGLLQSVDENQIELVQSLTKKQIKEGKQANIIIPFNDIKETRVEISFK